MTTKRDILSPEVALGTSRRRRSLAARVWSFILDTHELGRQRRALARLENHLLDDIGLTRDDVARELSRSIWK